jgi:uncharacterized protein with NRDE domain
MCLIVIGWQIDQRYPLVVAANRDEFFARPTAPLAWWEDHPDILAGRDLQDGGSWLGLTRNGRFAAITNYRDPARMKPGAPSRGRLVSDFLAGSETPRDYLQRIAPLAEVCNGFNLLVADTSELWWHSNVTGDIRKLEPGIHGVSNHLLDTPWPKLLGAKQVFADAVPELPATAKLFTLLRDDTQHPDEVLPNTGVSLELERKLSAIFVKTEGFNTRSSAVLWRDDSGKLSFDEQTWREDGSPGHRVRINT